MMGQLLRKGIHMKTNLLFLLLMHLGFSCVSSQRSITNKDLTIVVNRMNLEEGRCEISIISKASLYLDLSSWAFTVIEDLKSGEKGLCIQNINYDRSSGVSLTLPINKLEVGERFSKQLSWEPKEYAYVIIKTYYSTDNLKKDGLIQFKDGKMLVETFSMYGRSSLLEKKVLK